MKDRFDRRALRVWESEGGAIVNEKASLMNSGPAARRPLKDRSNRRFASAASPKVWDRADARRRFIGGVSRA
jgi:hypothetical protein